MRSRTRLRVVTRLPRYARLAWNLLHDERVTRQQKGLLLAAIGYNVSPIDLLPGVIPIAGQIDDLAVLLFTIRRVLYHLDTATAEEHLQRAGLSWQQLDDDLRTLSQIPGLLALHALRWAGRAGRAVWRTLWKRKARDS